CACSYSSMYLQSEGITPQYNTVILAIGKMLDYSVKSDADDFIVATVVGIMHQMQKQYPEKQFKAANPEAICPFMKMITLDDMLAALQENKHQISVPADIAKKANLAIEKMVAIG